MLVAIYHAERHGIVGPLGNLLRDLHGLLQSGRDQAQLAGGGMKVPKEQLVHAHVLDGLDEEGVDALTVTKLLLSVLKQRENQSTD